MSHDHAMCLESTGATGKLRVAVLMGGVGEEREVSIQSGSAVAQALRRAGVEVVAADIAPDNLSVLDGCDIDVFFIALHGRFGEDGRLQKILEDRDLVYTGSCAAASRLAFDKWESKQVFIQAGIRTPEALRFEPALRKEEIERHLGGPDHRYVVKPLSQGSTIGVTVEADAEAALDAARRCQDRFGDCMIERFIPGSELTVGILENEALPIIEIKTAGGFYDYEAKYLDERTQFLFDTIEDGALISEVEDTALNCFSSLGCRHFARVDFILGRERKLCALEVNTIPGFTSHSLLPMAAAKAGIPMGRLCMKIVQAALKHPSPFKEKTVVQFS